MIQLRSFCAFVFFHSILLTSIPSLGMYPDKNLREHLRFCLLNIMKTSQIFGSAEDSKQVTLFYGRILTKSLYPDGPETNFQPSFPVHHTSYGPWKAESFRCVSLFLSQVTPINILAKENLGSLTCSLHSVNQCIDKTVASIYIIYWQLIVLPG